MNYKQGYGNPIKYFNNDLELVNIIVFISAFWWEENVFFYILCALTV